MIQLSCCPPQKAELIDKEVFRSMLEDYKNEGYMVNGKKERPACFLCGNRLFRVDMD